MTSPVHDQQVTSIPLSKQTNRPTRRDPEPVTIAGRQGKICADRGGDSPATLAESTPRMGRRHLARIADQLTDRDHELLAFLDRHRFATSGQLARLFAPRFNGDNSAVRQTNRQLAKLHQNRLIHRLERRIGGVRAGSASSIWTLTTAGTKLANQRSQATGAPRRSRPTEPSLVFLDHTLAITELRVRLAELASDGRVISVDSSPEPDCWRRYIGSAGQPVWLKPDLETTTVTADGYEDHWFFEVDRATENPARVIGKCHQYQHYRASGIEQARTGIFPAVLWITPDARRRDQLDQRLASEPNIVHGLFHTVTIDDFAAVIRSGPSPTNTSPDTARKEEEHDQP